MLSRLDIDYSDVHFNPSKVVSIRNDITHTGQLRNIYGEKELSEIYSEYKAFLSVLIRIFL